MIEEGAGAPEFALPAVVGDDVETVGLSDYLGSDVIILAFYPGDFNPACDDSETDLDELDLFTMQKDVSILGIAGDSVFSHRAFADEYDLSVPLLSDVDGEVAAAYGLAVDDEEAGYRTRRGVVVVSPGGDVEFAWSTDDLRKLPPTDRVREVVDGVGGTETAQARYRVAHAHYVEGRRAFTKAMHGFEDEEWMMAESDFRRAHDEFTEAADQFNTAVRFGEDDHDIGYFELAEEKAEILWQAAEWLAGAANAFASGEGAEGESMRLDAERPLEQARAYPEPPEPDEFPPEEPPPDPAADLEDESESILPDDGEPTDASLDVDIDAAEAQADGDVRESVADGEPDGDATDDGAAATAADGDESEAGDDETEDEESIDEAELEEITAQLEEQTEQVRAEREAEATDDEEAGDGTDGGDRTDADEAAAEDGGRDADDAETGDEEADHGDEEADHGDGEADDGDEEVEELDLADPTGGEGLDPLEDPDDDVDEEGEEDEENPDDDLGNDGHGVPDSL